MPTMEIKIPTRKEPCFDGLARLSENLIVVKCVEEGEIYVFDFSQVGSQPARHGFIKKTALKTLVFASLL